MVAIERHALPSSTHQVGRWKEVRRNLRLLVDDKVVPVSDERSVISVKELFIRVLVRETEREGPGVTTDQSNNCTRKSHGSKYEYTGSEFTVNTMTSHDKINYVALNREEISLLMLNTTPLLKAPWHFVLIAKFKTGS